MITLETTLEERTALVENLTAQLHRLPRHQALGVALGVAWKLAEAHGSDPERFAAMAYVTAAHCDGSKEEAVQAMKEALDAVRATRR